MTHDPRPAGGRLPRVRRLGVVVLAALASLTGSSLTYNAVTRERAGPPVGLQFVQAGDVRTRYLHWGNSGPTVVLIPGAFETADTFAPLGELLGATHRVYALDLTGLGYSDPVGPYTVAHHAAQVAGLVQALDLGTPVVVGHSSGAAVAGLVATEHPTSVGGVLFLDGDAAPLPVPGFLPHLAIDPFRTTVLRLAVRSDTLIRRVYASQCGPQCPPLSAAGVEQWRLPLQQPGYEAAFVQTSRHGIIAFLTPAQLATLRAVDVPKAVVFGRDDSGYPADTPRLVADRIGAPPPTIIDGRHLTMISSPAAVAAVVAQLSAGG